LLTITVLSIFCLLMVRAAYSDLTSFTLSNRLCLSVALLYPVFLFALYLDGHGLVWPDILLSLAIAAVIFILLATLFAFNVMGGGDVKLIPAVALWAGPGHMLGYLFIMALLGGVIAAMILARNRIKASKYLKSSEIINLSMAQQEESAVPYGAGIAGGGLYVAYELFSTFTMT